MRKGRRRQREIKDNEEWVHEENELLESNRERKKCEYESETGKEEGGLKFVISASIVEVSCKVSLIFCFRRETNREEREKKTWT